MSHLYAFDLLVTEKHIALGIRGNPSLCPIARAIKDTFGVQVRVSSRNILFANLAPLGFLSPSTVVAIRTFDEGGVMAPGYYTIAIPYSLQPVLPATSSPTRQAVNQPADERELIPA